MRRSLALPLFLLACALLLGVMGWLTATVRRLDSSERAIREQAALEESVRLALWRVDSLLAPWLARESALPAAASPHVRVRFVWAPEGLRALHPTPSARGDESLRLSELARRSDRARLLARLGESWLPAEPAEKVLARLSKKTAPPPPPKERVEQARQEEQQKLLNSREYEARAQNVMVQQQAAVSRGLPAALEKQEAAPPPARVSAVEPVFLGDELLLARRVRRGAVEVIEGAWLDWPGLQEWLAGAVRDVLPEARLEPAREGESADVARRLASLPARLVPGRPTLETSNGRASLLLPLGVAWSVAALALVAVGALLFGMATLGERREAFVSAVTHELRTPLTTFRMYTEMLADGMVRGERERSEYLETLRREADRQMHLVENVLAYSRLERGRYRAARETVTVRALLAHILPTLSAQADRAGMTLVTATSSTEGPAADLEVAVDRAAVERILFNLVDNAGKYAKDAEDRHIHLEGAADGRSVLLSISDHGPGIREEERRQLFHAFRKSARDAAQSAPGVGLGLALSRRLARAIGGDLSFVPRPAGATFQLRLPRAPSRPAGKHAEGRGSEGGGTVGRTPQVQSS